MSQPDFSDIQQLVRQLVLPFYALERDLPLPIQNHRNENDAEHSWSLALLACSLAPEIDPQLDVGKICQYAVVHDLVEVYAGDTSVLAPGSELASKAVREAAALWQIKQRFTKFPWLTRTIEAYEKKADDEAVFVYALDKFLALLLLYEDGGYYYRHHKISKKRFDRQFRPHREKAHAHPAIGQYYDQLRDLFDALPELFHR